MLTDAVLLLPIETGNEGQAHWINYYYYHYFSSFSGWFNCTSICIRIQLQLARTQTNGLTVPYRNR